MRRHFMDVLFALMIIGLVMNQCSKSKPSVELDDRKAWEESVSFLESEALSNTSTAKRQEASVMAKLARSGFRLGYASGAKLCE